MMLALAAVPASGYASQKNSIQAKSVQKTAKKTVAKKSRASRPQERFSALVVDANTGRVLYEKNAGNIRYPASLTKMMTLYLAFDALKKGKLRVDQMLPVSAKAAGQPQTNIALSAGERIPLETAVESLVVRSANDAAVVLAEALGGTEWNFALNMTQKARELGMKNTIYRNANGLPDDKQHSTAYDQARLAIALRRDFPEYYHYFSLEDFNYNGVNYTTHNRVMQRYPGADGVKTGYIRASGFNLVTSVKRDGYNLVAVILGGTTSNGRDNQMMALLDRTFANLDSRKKSRLAQGDSADEFAASFDDGEQGQVLVTAQGF
jgi:D-alanyl-D-alanine carboxypeptidase